MMTGIRADSFRGGWAVPMNFNRTKVAHWYRREGLGPAVPICGAPPWPAGYLFHIGSWVACRRCVAKHGEPTAGERAFERMPMRATTEQLISWAPDPR